MNIKKRLISLVLALMMLVTGVSTSCFSFAATDSTSAHVYTYNDAVATVRDAFTNRMKKLKLTFEVTGEGKYSHSDVKSAMKLFEEIIQDAYLKGYADPKHPEWGDYLYNSVKSYSISEVRIKAENERVYDENGEYSDQEGRYYLVRHYYYYFTLDDIMYYSTAAQEQVVAKFAKEFNKRFITSDMSEYEIVKTIYDFLIRNTVYDDDVFLKKYSHTSSRYNIAHSAYGAICGNLLQAGKSYLDYSFATINTVTKQKVIDMPNQGLSVCEGYSKLFYYLCTMNGIQCHIVDGDYPSKTGEDKDPHEWNYVYLDDGMGDGYQWYQVDSTFAEQKSIKELHLHSYDLFLRGSGNVNFSEEEHQQPYSVTHSLKPQLYNWYSKKNRSSVRDYMFGTTNISAQNAISHGFIIVRKTDYNDGEGIKYSYVYTDENGMQIIRIDDEGRIFRKNIDGFGYTGHKAEYDVIVPYLVDTEYGVQGIEGIAQANNDYSLTVFGDNNSKIGVSFHVTPYDMSGDHKSHYKKANIQRSANYTGKKSSPKIEIIDSYGNRLKKERDFTVSYYSDKAYTKKVKEIKNIGTYYVDIAFKNNYYGHYRFVFKMKKIDLSQMNLYNNRVFKIDYIPEYFRNKRKPKITSPAVYYRIGVSKGLSVGNMKIKPNTDFSVISKGGLEYGDSGTITLIGLSGSKKIQAKTYKRIKYKVAKKYSISQMNGEIADSRAIYSYTGKAIEPKTLNVLDKKLVRGKDYSIVSYYNNVNAGKAYVKIKGIGGCEGTAYLVFRIFAADFSKAKISAQYVNNRLVYSVKYNYSELKKNTDYTVTKKTTSYGFLYTFKGIGNFQGVQYVSLYLENETK